MKHRPLDELEMFDLFQLAYPEKFSGDDDETWDAVQEFAEMLSGWDEIADLLGRVAMLTMPMQSGMTKRWSHCFGSVTVNGDAIDMCAAVRRDVLSAPTPAE